MHQLKTVTAKPIDSAIVVEIYEDFVCPWCRIGRANLDAAIGKWDGPVIQVKSKPFLLDPTIPPEGLPFVEYMVGRFGGGGALAEKFEPVVEMGAQAGLTFRFDLMTRAANSMRAHRLVEIAPEHRRNAIAVELFDRYFEDGQDIGDPDLLAEVARLHGVEPQSVYGLLSGPDATLGVVSSMREAQQIGITGVPFFVVAEQYGIGGAQPPERLLQVLNMVRDSPTMSTN